MNRAIILILFLIITKTGLAQNGKDTIVFKLPVVNGKLTYTDSIGVQGHNKAVLDSAAKKWINSYFKYHWADTVSKHKDARSSVLSWGILEFRAPPNSMRVVYYSYYLWVTIKINCEDGYYTYKISDACFRPQSNFFNKIVVHPTNADWLIDIYKKKDYGLMHHFDGSTIRYYLSGVNTAIVNCIASLNKAMAN
ncbi:MAG: hypothetical protein JWR09_3526 [Mucilaginibacter sp.]|nr:hypothetical protein [Mucilaginibacter sp.]